MGRLLQTMSVLILITWGTSPIWGNHTRRFFMKGMHRRRFLQIAGAGSVAGAVGTVAAVPALTAASQLTASSKQGTFTFRAVAGLPSEPMPTYASYVIQGHIDLTTRT